MVNFYLIVGLISILVIFMIFLAIGKYQQQKFVSVKIGNATVHAELADTEPKQMRGLMFRDNLPKDGGMLFTFGRDGKYGIWMMNTSVALDILWLEKNKKVVYMKEDAQPCDALLVCSSYSPDEDSRYVLEVRAGYAKSHGIKIGSVAKFDV